MKLACKTDIGNQRSENQDNYRAGRQPDETVWAVVCDGMGGAKGGKYAAEIATDYIEKVFTKELSTVLTQKELRPFLLHTINAANTKIYNEAQINEAYEGMGTTIVGVIVREGYAHFAHVGDSRIYFYRNNTLELATKDHSMVQELVEHGRITESEAKNHPHKNLITRALGVSKDVTSDYAKTKVFENDVILLCSDGLTNCVKAEEIANILNSVSFFDCPQALIEKALSNGGQDNITVVLMQIEGMEERHG